MTLKATHQVDWWNSEDAWLLGLGVGQAAGGQRRVRGPSTAQRASPTPCEGGDGTSVSESEPSDDRRAYEIRMEGVSARVRAGQEHSTVSVLLLDVLIGDVDAESIAETGA